MTDQYFNFKEITVEKILESAQTVYDCYNRVKNDVINVSAVRTFKNTVMPLINVATDLEPTVNLSQYALNFDPNKEIRDVGLQVSTDINKFLLDFSVDKQLYQALTQYEQFGDVDNDEDDLTDEEKRSFTNLMREFKRNGVHLEETEFTLFIELKKQVLDMCAAFAKNINEDNTVLEFTKEQLEGMPDSWLNCTNNKNTYKDTYNLTLNIPDYIQAITYIKSSLVRKTVFEAYSSKGGEVNMNLMKKVAEIRHILAQKLGYKNHADFMTEVKIVKTGDNAYSFLENLNSVLTPAYKEEMVNLQQFAQKDNISKLEEWDVPYYIRLYKEYVCDINMEEIRHFFPLSKVKEGLFNIYQHLLGLTFKQIETDNVWHNTVTLYSVTDSKTQELLGYFYLDMYTRSGKFANAAAFDFMTGNRSRPHIVTITCNFPQPEDNCDETYITFYSVVTFFHEFGHVMHQICSRTQLIEFAGFHVERDFIEAPSQMLENWCYEEQSLKMMSKELPTELIQKLIKTKNVMRAYRNKRQLKFGLFDLKIHMLNKNIDKNLDLQKIWYQIESEVMLNNVEEKDQLYPMSSFNHLMNGYDAGYYGYLRSECYAANMFCKHFKGDNILSKEAGLRYRKLLLERGATKDGLELLRDFLGEEPDDSYFIIN